MNLENLLITGSVSLIFSGIGWALKTSIVGELKRIGKDIGDLRAAVNSYREEMIRDYARNVEVHEVRNEVRDLRDKILKVETTQQNCKSCRGD